MCTESPGLGKNRTRFKFCIKLKPAKGIRLEPGFSVLLVAYGQVIPSINNFLLKIECRTGNRRSDCGLLEVQCSLPSISFIYNQVVHVF